MQTFINFSVKLVYCMKKQEMVRVLHDPEKEKIFDNPNYVRILLILRKGEMNIKKIHKLFNEDYEDKKTLTSIYRYMEKLLENDLVFVSREEIKRKHLIEKYYSRTARFFTFDTKSHSEKRMNSIIDLLHQIYGFQEDIRDELKTLIKTHEQNLTEFNKKFYEEHGIDVLKIEEKYGFEIAKDAAKSIYELKYFKNNTELLKKIFGALKK